MAWAHQDYDQTLTLREQRKDYGRRMKEKLLEADEQIQKAKELAETWAADLEVALTELKAAQDELDRLRESSSKYRDDSVMEILRLTALAEGAERKLAEVP